MQPVSDSGSGSQVNVSNVDLGINCPIRPIIPVPFETFPTIIINYYYYFELDRSMIHERHLLIMMPKILDL